MKFLDKIKFFIMSLMVLSVVLGIKFNISGVLYLIFVFGLGLLSMFLLTRRIFKDIEEERNKNG